MKKAQEFDKALKEMTELMERAREITLSLGMENEEYAEFYARLAMGEIPASAYRAFKELSENNFSVTERSLKAQMIMAASRYTPIIIGTLKEMVRKSPILSSMAERWSLEESDKMARYVIGLAEQSVADYGLKDMAAPQLMLAAIREMNRSHGIGEQSVKLQVQPVKFEGESELKE